MGVVLVAGEESPAFESLEVFGAPSDDEELDVPEPEPLDPEPDPEPVEVDDDPDFRESVL